jgi:tetratricopeptide (TPR) repeat protein
MEYPSKAKNHKKKQQSEYASCYIITDLKAYLILALTCFICYGNTLLNDYSWDDSYVITETVDKGLDGIHEILTQPYSSSHNKVFEYRPVVHISFALEHTLFGRNPHASHFINIILYVIIVLQIYMIFKNVFHLEQIHVLLPLLISGFYAIHPSHTEVVASLKNREELLSACFMLGTVLYAYKFLSINEYKVKYAYLSLFLLLLSFASKLSFITMIPVIIMMGFYYGFHINKNRFYTFVIAMIAVFFVFDFYKQNIILSEHFREVNFWENPLSINQSLPTQIGTSLNTLLFYLKFLFYPYPFRFYYGYNVIPLVSISDSEAILSFIIHLILLLYGGWHLYKQNLIGIFITAYLISISVYSNFFNLYTGIVSERALFLPSLWFIAAFFLLLFQWLKIDRTIKALNNFQKLITGIIILIFLCCGWVTIHRNSQWKDELTLLTVDIEHLKQSTLGNFYYGWVLEQEADRTKEKRKHSYFIKKAVEYHKHAIKLSPEYPEPYFRLGKLYAYELYEPDSAFECFYTSYHLNTSKVQVQFQLARLYYLRNNFAIADNLFGDLYTKLPNDTLTLFFWAQVKYLRGDTAYARTINNQLLELAPQTHYPYVNMGYFNKLGGYLFEAVNFYHIAIKNGCTDPDIVKIVIDFYASTGQFEKVREIEELSGNSVQTDPS